MSINPVGFAFAVSNPKKPKGPVHHVIPTVHLADLEIIQNPFYKQTIEKCSALFTERGINCHINSNDGCLPGTVQHDVPYPYSLDAFLTMTAWCRKIPIRSLDEQVPEIQEIYNMEIMSRKERGADAFDNVALEFNKSMQPEVVSLIKNYKERNLDGLTKEREEVGPPLRDTLITKREKKWAQILIPLLLNADKPHCIAIGCLHTIGPDSMPELLAKGGLKVKLITPSCHQSRL